MSGNERGAKIKREKDTIREREQERKNERMKSVQERKTERDG